MDKTGLIDLKIPEARDYSKFYLKRNPFPAIGIPEETPSITVDRELVVKRFQNVIWELLENGESIITVMVGEYGSGKTHLLKIFKESVNTQLLPSQKALAVYIKTPGEDFSHLFFAFIDDIGFDLLTQLSSRFTAKVMRSEPGLLKNIFNQETREKFKTSKISLEEVLEDLRLFQLATDLRVSIFEGINSDLSLAFTALIDPQLSSIAWKWLLGESLTKEEKDEIHIHSSIEPKDTVKIFHDFIILLQRIGITNLVILVDELEKITLLMKTKKDKYQDDLRRFIDDHPRNICFYLAIAPRQWSDLTKEPTALVRRLKGNWHLLEDFKEDETRELIENYLYSVRLDQYPGKKIKDSFPSCDPSLYPFSEDSIASIAKKSKGVVSDILLIARKALELLCDLKNYPIITPELVNRATSPK